MAALDILLSASKQWGVTSANNNGTTVTFPMPFSTTNINITTSSIHTNISWENNGTDSFGGITKNNFKVYFGYGSAQTINWHAIGF